MTATQTATVEMAANLPIASPSAVARLRGISRQSAHEILTRPDVSAELARLRAERSDKARGSLAQLDGMLQRAATRLGQLVDQAEAIEAVAVIRTMIEMIPKYEAYLDAKHAEDRDVASLADLERAARHRGVKIGAYLQRRAMRPQAESASPPSTLDVVVSE